MVLARTSRAQRALANGVRSIVTSRGSVIATRQALARQVPHQGSSSPVLSAAAGRLLKPHNAVTSSQQREHATAAGSKLGALRTDWT